MINKLIILSDIHGNLSALKAVIDDFESKQYYPDGIVILGDNINYGMQPNEVIGCLKTLSQKYSIVANIWGNHEKAIFDGDLSHFSTERGKQILQYTNNRLTAESKKYLIDCLSPNGVQEIQISNKRVLIVHGSLSNPFWGKMTHDEMDKIVYTGYDYVISGHSHVPNLTEKFFEDSSQVEYRNKKRIVFLNPGSVGQPRNHNPKAQYLYICFSNECVHFNSVDYNIEYEKSLYSNDVDNFYARRLELGI
ncbi:MAG: metallophosphoesterase family protein [Muribaculaceae bacterium]|nr:metallophosphoesterase family protein [Muribaculaceae bacterium]